MQLVCCFHHIIIYVMLVHAILSYSVDFSGPVKCSFVQRDDSFCVKISVLNFLKNGQFETERCNIKDTSWTD